MAQGRSVAIVANDPSVLAGTIDGDAADKAAHFLDVADAFGLPCVFLADNPGVWMIHCHQLIHAAGGMMALLAYDGAPRLAQLGGTYGNNPD